MLTNLTLVALGGAIGSALRYTVALWCLRFAQSSADFPLATLAVNVIGCFVMGACLAFVQHSAEPPQAFKLLIMTGLLGGFTTFSAFGGETMLLLNSDAPFRGVLNFLLNPILSVAAVWCGLRLSALFV